MPHYEIFDEWKKRDLDDFAKKKTETKKKPIERFPFTPHNSTLFINTHKYNKNVCHQSPGC